MSMTAGKSRVPFEPKMQVLADAAATTETPENLRFELGSIANLSYKPARFTYHLRTDDTPTQGVAEVRLVAGQSTLRTEVIDLNGVDSYGNTSGIDLSGIEGQTQLSVEVEITSAADAGRVITIDAFLDIEQPPIITGC